MGRRRRGRELALKILYRLDLTGESWEDVRLRADEYESHEPVLRFGEELVDAVLAHREAIDDALRAVSERWRIDRMPYIDRNILRIALAEHLVLGGPDRAVIIDEAVDIARAYSTDEAGAFVNGVLDRILREREPGSIAGGGAEAVAEEDRDPPSPDPS